MDIDVFKKKMVQCAAQLRSRVADAEIDGLYERMKHWTDKIIDDIIRNVSDDEKKFPVWAVWKAHRAKIMGIGDVKALGRSQFYSINDCPVCGYGETVPWNNRFDRQTYFIHVKCPHGLGSRWTDEAKKEYMRQPQSAFDIHPFSQMPEDEQPVQETQDVPF